jgi:hypothetical protein
MEAIVMKRQQRKLKEPFRPELVFYVRGQKVEQAKIERWMHRKGISDDALFVPSRSACKISCLFKFSSL